MTHDETMDGLAQRIAELKPDWALPGMAARDPETGAVFRRADSASMLWRMDNDAALALSVCEYYAAQPIAIASGPHWRDPVTALGLLALLPDDYAIGWIDRTMIVTHEVRREYWCARKYHPVFLDTFSTREEAILRAVVAHLEAKS